MGCVGLLTQTLTSSAKDSLHREWFPCRRVSHISGCDSGSFHPLSKRWPEAVNLFPFLVTVALGRLCYFKQPLCIFLFPLFTDCGRNGFY